MKSTFDDLTKRLNYTLTNYETFLADPEQQYKRTNPLYGVAHMLNKRDLSAQLQIGSRRFLLKGHLKLSLRLMHLVTYEIVQDTESYPRQKLKHIPELDIVMDEYGTRFIKKIPSPNNMVNLTVIREFGPQYTAQLWSAIEQMEIAEVPKIDQI